MLTFNDYFGGLDQYNLDRGRYQAFFVYNRATSREIYGIGCGIKAPMIMCRPYYARSRWMADPGFSGQS